MMKQNAGILFHGGTMRPTADSAYDVDGQRKYITRKEGQKFLQEAVQMPKIEALFCLTLFYTGCRITEVLTIIPKHLDETTNVIAIHSLKKRQRKAIRRIPIPEYLAKELASIASISKEQRLWSFSRTTGWRIVKKVMKQAGIFGIHGTAKGLRHGFGVRSALEQIPLNLIKNWMGHADLETTSIYLDVKDEEERALIGRTWTQKYEQ